jgi:hypothetical protein
MLNKVKMKNLEKLGYKKFSSHFKDRVISYIISYQKKFKDENGIRYFLNFHVYDNINIPNYEIGKYGRYSYEASCQFNSHGDKATFDVLRFVGIKDHIEEVEDFFKVMFVSMECNYYELFE